MIIFTPLQQDKNKIKDLETINKNMINKFNAKYNEIIAKMNDMELKHENEIKTYQKIIIDLNVKIDKIEKENVELKVENKEKNRKK